MRGHGDIARASPVARPPRPDYPRRAKRAGNGCQGGAGKGRQGGAGKGCQGGAGKGCQGGAGNGCQGGAGKGAGVA